MTADECRVSRSVFWWAVCSRRLRWSVYKALMKSLIHEERRLSACAGKEAFRTFEKASYVLARAKGRRAIHGPLRVYRCDACGQFHLGQPASRENINARPKAFAHA